MSDEEDNDQGNEVQESDEEEEEEVVVDNEEEEEVVEDNQNEEGEDEEEQQPQLELLQDKIQSQSQQEQKQGSTQQQIPKVQQQPQQQQQKKKEEIDEEEKAMEDNHNDEDEQIQGEGFTRIKDPNVLKLMKINLQSTDKESIINILMKNNALETRNLNDTQQQNRLSTKDKTKRKYQQTGSIHKTEEQDEVKYSKTDKFHIYRKDDDPQLTSDFNVATKKIMSMMMTDKDSEVMKILFADDAAKKAIPSEITREQITQKVNNALNKKQEEIEKIATRYNQEYNEKHTFAPQLISQQPPHEKRNLTQFLDDQKNHQKKVQDKIENLKVKEQENESKKGNNHPVIDKNSEEMFKSCGKSGEPVYERLFNTKYQSAKTNLLKDQTKEKDQKKNNKDITKEKLPKKKKTQPKKTIPLDPEIDKSIKPVKAKKKEEKIVTPKPLMKADELYRNEILLKNFIAHYEEMSAPYKPEQQDPNEEPKKIKINQQQIHALLAAIGMCSAPKLEEITSGNPIAESALQIQEKKLIESICETLKDAESEVNIEHLKQFLICAINLHLYQLYKEYTKKHTSEEIKKLIPIPEDKDKANEQARNLKDITIEYVLKEMNKEIKSKVDITKPSKYICFDTAGNILIPINKSKLIKKDFDLFAITYMSNRPKPQYKKEKEIKAPLSFKPTINNNSEKMYKNFRAKVSKDDDLNSEEAQNKKIEYIDRIILKKKKKMAENLKQKEENEQKELEQCTFKPKTNDISITKTTGANRYNELFHKGSEKERNRRDRTQEDFDFEKSNECTFTPHINSKDPENIPKTNFSNDIFNEKSYRLQYERLRNGRMEHLIKEAVHERFALDNVLQDYIKKNKEGGHAEEEEEEPSNAITEEKVCENAIEKEPETNDINSDVDAVVDSNQITTSQSPDEAGDEYGEKKESIPLLIIDVNIRQGVKKKIFVHEGDTPQGLSEKFAAEHNLEPQTKEKLQSLIHNHMLRLLTRIDEEAQSVSEKSSALNQGAIE